MTILRKNLSFSSRRIIKTHPIKGINKFSSNHIDNGVEDKGSYLLILSLKNKKRIRVGGLGEIYFPKGFYIYVGSAMSNLQKRMERHLRLEKRLHWHIDYLRAKTNFHSIIPIHSIYRIECKIAKALSGISQWNIAGFGCSDCSCNSHLFGMEDDPLRSVAFQRMMKYFRS